MDNLTQPASYNWKSDEFPVCRLTIRAQKLADALGLRIDTWEENGLGDAVGFLCQSKNGSVIYAVELLHAVAHLGDKGPVIYAEASDVAENGVMNTVNSILSALSLTIDSVDWIQPVSAQEAAKEPVTWVMAYRGGK